MCFRNCFTSAVPVGKYFNDRGVSTSQKLPVSSIKWRSYTRHSASAVWIQNWGYVRSYGIREPSSHKRKFVSIWWQPFLNAALAMPLWYKYATQKLLYKCIGANDKIFDHFILLSSDPTTPKHSISRYPMLS